MKLLTHTHLCKTKQSQHLLDEQFQLRSHILCVDFFYQERKLGTARSLFIKNFLVGSVLIPMFLCSLSIILASFHHWQSLFSFNPLTLRILLVILLTVCLTVLVMLLWRIWYWISLWSPDWYLFFIFITCLHILYWYCKEKFCLGHSSPTLLYM